MGLLSLVLRFWFTIFYPDGSVGFIITCFVFVSDGAVSLVGAGDPHGANHPEGPAADLQPDRTD